VSAPTTCKRGHEFTPENTYEWHGSRHCRQCRRERGPAARSRRRVRAAETPFVAVENFWQRTRVEPSGCRIVLRISDGAPLALDDKGYPRITLRGTRWFAHRYAWTLANGPIPDGMEIDHLCRNTACCEPTHLEPVTGKVNKLRAPGSLNATNAAKTHCPQGHEYAGENLRVRPSDGARECMACLRERGRRRSKVKVAQEPSVSCVACGKTLKLVNLPKHRRRYHVEGVAA
jgi:hypothetical protein